MKSPSRRSSVRQLVRESDGTIRDLTEESTVSHAELREHLASGGYFRALRRDGTDCSSQVLWEVLQDGMTLAWGVGTQGPGAPVSTAFDSMERILGLADQQPGRRRAGRRRGDDPEPSAPLRE